MSWAYLLVAKQVAAPKGRLAAAERRAAGWLGTKGAWGGLCWSLAKAEAACGRESRRAAEERWR